VTEEVNVFKFLTSVSQSLKLSAQPDVGNYSLLTGNIMCKHSVYYCSHVADLFKL